MKACVGRLQFIHSLLPQKGQYDLFNFFVVDVEFFRNSSSFLFFYN